MNPYYNASGNPVTLARGASSVIRAEYSAVENGFTNFSNAIPAIVADAVAVGGLATNCTSTTSNTIANSVTLTFTVETDKPFAVGMTIKFASTASPTNSVTGDITSYDSETGVMIIAVSASGAIGSGTFASWSGSLAYTPVPVLTYPSLPAGEAVAAGNLLAMDDSGNSMSAAAVTTSVLQAVTATSLHSCPLSNGNTAIFWTAGSTDYRMMVIDKTGATVLASTSVATGVSGGVVWSAQLTNGNIVFVYLQVTTSYPAFKIVNTSGTQIVAETVIESVSGVGQIKCCALTGGGFAVTYGSSPNNRYAVYTNAGAVTKAATNNVAGVLSRVAICPTAAGGFIALAGTNSLGGTIYDSAGNSIVACAISINTSTASADANIASISGSCVAVGCSTGTYAGPVAAMASDSTNTVINGISSGSLQVSFNDVMSAQSLLGNAYISALANGNYLATFSTRGNNEYPRYAIFNSIGQIVKSGVMLIELINNAAPVFTIPKDTNGFSLIYLATNGNIKFGQIKSGKVVGVSLGLTSGFYQYETYGEVTLASTNILNVGSEKINYSRQGVRVVI